MDVQPSSTDPRPASSPDTDPEIPGTARFMIWLFVLVFIWFGAVLIGDLLSGLWR